MTIHSRILVLLVLVATPAWAEVKAETLVAIITKVQLADAAGTSSLIQAAANLPETYVTKKLDRVRQLDVGAAATVRGVLECEKLVALAIEEKPGDVDPLLFVRDGETFRLLLNLGRLRDSGLDKDEQCLKDYAEIDRWIEGLKKK